MKEKILLKELTYKLDKIICLLAINITLNKKRNEQINLLSKIGFQPKEIANILGTTPNTVRVALTHIRKKSKR